jgi:hypothetical protein
MVIVRVAAPISISSWVTESSQPVAAVVLAVVPVLEQDIEPVGGSTFVSPEPPSRKFTWMSASGGLMKVTLFASVGWSVVQLVPVTTVALWSVGAGAVP